MTRTAGRRWLWVLLAAATLGACQPYEPIYREQVLVFGTRVDITLWGVDPPRAQQAMAVLKSDFARMHRDWHAWKPGALTLLNQSLTAGHTVQVDPFLLPLLERAQALAALSDDLFNPAIGRLIGLWGFHGDVFPSGRPPPSAEAVTQLLAHHPSMADVEIRGNEVRSRNPAVQLDFGGFAKGYAIDLAIGRLRRLGITNAIINGGGDLRAIGRPGRRPWRVGIRHPQGQGLLATLEVSGDESVFTSGNYERYNKFQGVRYPHIIDPRTGWPVQGVSSVTVLADNGALADAAATALVVTGPQEWLPLARRMGLTAILRVEADGAVFMTPAMARRIQFHDPAPTKRHITEQP